MVKKIIVAVALLLFLSGCQSMAEHDSHNGFTIILGVGAHIDWHRKAEIEAETKPLPLEPEDIGFDLRRRPPNYNAIFPYFGSGYIFHGSARTPTSVTPAVSQRECRSVRR